MQYHKSLISPRYIYPLDPWRWVEKQFYPKLLVQMETLFSTASGYLGMRDYNGHLSFHPKLPETVKRLRFPLMIQGQRLEVDIQAETATSNRCGKELS